jgi:hypothetical protein
MEEVSKYVSICEMYAHHNNSDQITNMYTVTQKTERCIKKFGLYIKFIFHFSPKVLSKYFSLC